MGQNENACFHAPAVKAVGTGQACVSGQVWPGPELFGTGPGLHWPWAGAGRAWRAAWVFKKWLFDFLDKTTAGPNVGKVGELKLGMGQGSNVGKLFGFGI